MARTWGHREGDRKMWLLLNLCRVSRETDTVKELRSIVTMTTVIVWHKMVIRGVVFFFFFFFLLQMYRQGSIFVFFTGPIFSRSRTFWCVQTNRAVKLRLIISGLTCSQICLCNLPCGTISSFFSYLLVISPFTILSHLLGVFLNTFILCSFYTSSVCLKQPGPPPLCPPSLSLSNLVSHLKLSHAQFLLFHISFYSIHHTSSPCVLAVIHLLVVKYLLLIWSIYGYETLKLSRAQR